MSVRGGRGDFLEQRKIRGSITELLGRKKVGESCGRHRGSVPEPFGNRKEESIVGKYNRAGTKERRNPNHKKNAGRSYQYHQKNKNEQRRGFNLIHMCLWGLGGELVPGTLKDQALRTRNLGGLFGDGGKKRIWAEKKRKWGSAQVAKREELKKIVK